MRIIGKQEATVVPSAKTGKDVYKPEQCDEVGEHVLIAGTVQFLHYVLF